MNLVHTRTIANPSSALKVNGKQGRHTYGVFTAQDDVTNLMIPGATGSSSGSFDMTNNATVGRYRYDFGRNSTVGAMDTNREGDDYSNRVISIDTRYRFSDSDLISASVVATQTEYNDDMVEYFGLEESELDDTAFQFNYRHSKRNWGARFHYSEYGKDYRSDLGFKP